VVDAQQGAATRQELVESLRARYPNSMNTR
jgi:hypothetical protein